MNAIEMLTNQHRQMEAALKAVADADGASSSGRRDLLFAKAADLLMSHVQVEEQLFYPAVHAKKTEDILLESLEEHLSLKRVLADLIALPADAPTFEPKFHVLAEQAHHHHKEEEEHLFPKVKKLMTEEELDALGDSMEAAQSQLLKNDPRTLAAEQTSEATPLTEAVQKV